MPLGDEYDLAPFEEDVIDDIRDAYTGATDPPWTEEVEVEAEFLLERYDAWPSIGTYQANPRNQYRNARNMLREQGRDYSAEALGLFLSVADFDRDPTAVKPGIFVSAAVTELGADHVTLPDLSEVDYAFYRNENDVTVKGDVGDRAAYQMRKGTLRIEGDAGSHCGQAMRDGSITVEGDAGRALGHGMRDGSITVEGDAGDLTGLKQKGGRIAVDGSAGIAPEEDRKGTVVIETDA